MANIERHARNMAEYAMRRFDARRDDGVTNANGRPLTLRLSYNSAVGDSDGITEADEQAITERAAQMIREGGYAVRVETPEGADQWQALIAADEADLD